MRELSVVLYNPPALPHPKYNKVNYFHVCLQQAQKTEERASFYSCESQPVMYTCLRRCTSILNFKVEVESHKGSVPKT